MPELDFDTSTDGSALEDNIEYEITTEWFQCVECSVKFPTEVGGDVPSNCPGCGVKFDGEI